MISRMEMSGFRKFLILLYKGLLLRKRHYIVTAFEIIFPVLIASIPAIIQSEANIPSDSSHGGGSYWVNASFRDPINPFTSGSTIYGKTVFFIYAPSNNNTDQIVSDSVNLWNRYQARDTRIEKLLHIEELENYCMTKQRENDSYLIIGTQFNNIGSRSLPSDLDYTIRISYPWSYLNGFSTNLKYRFSGMNHDSAYSVDTHFLSWQASVEKAFIKKKMVEKGENFDYEISMQEFPFPKHKVIREGASLQFLIAALIIYGFIIFVPNLIQRVIEEKSNGSKELLKMMGMTDFIYWTSTFLNYFFVGAIVFMVITIVYKSPLKHGIILCEHSNGLLLLVLFLLYVASLIMFCLAFTPFFNKPMFGTIFIIIIYNVCYSLLSSLVFSMNKEVTFYSLPLLVKFCICLFPPGAMLTICDMLMTFEASGEGLQWYNLYSYDAVPDLNLSLVMIAILFSCFLYSVILWYFDAVWPWQNGVPKPFYFPFTKSYWCGYEQNSVEEFLVESDEAKSTEFFEDEPVGVTPGVVISNLSKVFRNGLQTKVAVNNLSLNLYNGQITALLGHNGAGKTTTINILTGLYSPSSGSASINGWDIFTQTSKARQSLGVCPQHNVLYDTLTVEEHLKLYAALKGVSWSKLNDETTRVMNLLNLSDKKSVITKSLSGGMKRKLCLGIAIIGGSKVLFLDEPTSGMDVEARRSVWDALLDLRHNHTIVLTTHYMEEADILGDRIAIMAEGEVQCCGSSIFLKKKFGTGYHLHVVKNENFSLNAFTTFLTKYLPNASMENDYEGEVTFNLMSNNSSNFGSLFEEIESNKDALGVNSCGVTVTTMEDVFLNVASISDLKLNKDKVGIENEEDDMKDMYIESSIFGKSPLIHHQFFGLFLKRLHYAKRYWSVLISQLILPFSILCLCLFTINSTSTSSSQPSLKLDILEVYGKTDGFYQSDSESKRLADEINKVLQTEKVSVKPVDDPNQYILDYGARNLADYYKRLLVGATVEKIGDKLNVTAWFNGYPYHAQPMSLSLIDSAILRFATKNGHITVTNNPLPYVHTYFYEDNRYTIQRILANVFIPLALSFLSASFVYVPIHEKTSKAKLLQLMTGISYWLYWLSMFAWDFLVHSVVSSLLVIPFAIFCRYAFFSPHSEAIGTAVLIFLVYGWSSIPFSYLFSLIFKKPNTGFSALTTISIITGVAICSVLTTMMEMIENNKTAIAFFWILKLFPSYALSSGFSNLFAIAFKNSYCESFSPVQLKYNCMKADNTSAIFKCCTDICGNKCLVKDYPITWSKDGCGRDIAFLFLDGILYFALLLFLESYFVRSLLRIAVQRLSMLRKSAINQFADCNYVEDSEVLNEEERVRNNYEQLSHNDALVVLNLTKQFKGLKAVDRLTFGIHEKECFGLLGVNGAGKTTTFRMITGDCFPTEGNAFIGSYSLTNNFKKFQSNIGYCPQFDALIDRLSGREMITLFARLRGLTGANVTKYVNALIQMTDLAKHADKPSMVYSGGNKRKLSIALALIGSPPLLLLDEPTAGVDPVSRRKIWKILSFARSFSQAAVILTTHSMEESEALCSRLAIMVNGRFRCLGSIQQLKSKFGQGYSLIIKMKKEEQSIPQSMNAVKAYIDTNLPGANLKDDHQGMLQYHVVDPSMTLSRLFKFMDDMKKSCNLEDYIVSDTSLEQIFLAFARSQRVVAASC